MNMKDTAEVSFKEKVEDFIHDMRYELKNLKREITYKRRVFKNRLFDKTYRTTFKEILQTGKFGGLETGITIEQLICAMGEPHGGRGESKYGGGVWFYEDTEVYIHEDSRTVNLIKLRLDYGFKFPVNIVLDGYFPKSGTTLAQFEDYLQHEAIQYVVLWDGGHDVRWCNVFTASGKVSILFGEETLEIIGIYAHDDLTGFKVRLANHIALTIFDILHQYVEQNSTGKVFYGYSAKLGITENIRLSVSYKAGRRPTQRYNLSVPDLGIEVIKPHTNMEDLLSTVRRFFYSKAKEFWIVFPSAQEIHQYKGSEPNGVRIYRGSQKIDAEALFPGIEGLTTDAIFKLPEWIFSGEE
jgi:Uma2 family endonuclease